MQRGLSIAKVSVRLSVCPSVCLSVTRVNCDKTKETSADILIPYERKIHLHFWTQRMVGGGVSVYLKFWIKLTDPASKTAIFNRYSLVPPQPLHLAKKFNYD